MRFRNYVVKPTGYTALLLLAALVSACFTYALFLPVKESLAAQAWEETSCTVRDVSLRVDTHESTNSEGDVTVSTYYGVDITYLYEFDGRQLVGKRFDFSGDSDGFRERREQAVKDLKTHPATTCFVDPADVHRVVLDRRLHPSIIFFPALATVITLLMLVFAALTAVRRAN